MKTYCYNSRHPNNTPNLGTNFMSHVKTKISTYQCTSKLSTFFTTTRRIFALSKIPTLKMESQQHSKRPTCPSCSKPLSLCLCIRLKTPNLENKVHVTILQHSLETKHPLNSAKIAKLGLKNVNVFTVTDVMFEAQFDIHPLGLDGAENLLLEECTPTVCGNASENLGVKISGKRGFDQVDDLDSGGGYIDVSDSEMFSGCIRENVDESFDFEGSGDALAKKDDHLLKQCAAEYADVSDNVTSKNIKERPKPVMSVTISKYGAISNISHQWKLQDEGKTLNLEHLIASPEALKSLGRGFVIKKLQKKQISGSVELEQFEEFQITVPPGSALLFPAQKAMPADAVDFEVKNLIVLDGTWSKANRMYNENPWLRILPSVRLDVEKLSMFSDVRRQPKPGYLSSIESIVYALDALGGCEKLEGLDNLLDVFESMVEDQRRFKEEALKKACSIRVLTFNLLLPWLIDILLPWDDTYTSALELPTRSHSHDLNVWPKPTKLEWEQPSKAAFLSSHFTIKGPRNNPHLVAAMDRYQALIRSESHVPLVNPEVEVVSASYSIKVLQIKVADLTATLQHGVDESYNLNTPASGAAGPAAAVLSANTPWGAMRGLETFSQLVWVGGRQVHQCPLLVVPLGLDIWDSPIFGHRGLLLDTSRNYYGVEDILKTISAMSWNKLNVFHWHITDSHSFPLLLPSDPDLAIKGSYGPYMQYTPADVARIVQFGFDHGVRVIPEIDSPAHTGSWAGAHPEIVTCAGMFWWPAGSEWADRLASEPGSGQLNPIHPKTYQVMKKVIKDTISLFPDSFYHSGGDEVVSGCWTTDSTIQAFLANYSSSTKNKGLSKLLEIFVNSTLPYVISHKKSSIYWEDVILDSTIKVEDLSILPPEHTILQTWNGGPQNIKRLVSSGYRTIVSSSDYYYLDCGHGSFVGNDSQYNQPPGTAQGNGGSWCGPFKTWQLIYNYDITDGLTQEEKKLVLGGEVALWSEQADPTVLDSRLWPRASALAESMWSGNRDDTGKKRYGEVTNRLNEWRYRMVARGVGAEPIQPLWCVRNPGMCNTVQATG